MSAPDAYSQAHRIFVLGYLEESQREANQEYRRFAYSNAAWARKFQLLEATAMVWRGLNEEALELLSEDESRWPLREDDVERLGLEGRALTGLHQFSEADQKLTAAEALCDNACSYYGMLLRSRGKFFLELGQMQAAENTLLASLRFAREGRDGLLESANLLTIGFIASQKEHHDEASDLYRQAYQVGASLGANDIEQRALANQGWEQYQLGNIEKALDLYKGAEIEAVTLGSSNSEIDWIKAQAKAYEDLGQSLLAETTDLRAIKLAQRLKSKQDVIDASMDLAEVYVDTGRPNEAEQYANLAMAMSRETGSPLDLLNAHLIEGQAAAFRRDWSRADALLREVSESSDSQPSMKWDAQRALGNIYEAQGNAASAEVAYRASLALVEASRAGLGQEAAQLTFRSKATRAYDDYIHFLVAQGRVNEALEVADWSRARTLQQGLGLISPAASTVPRSFRATEIARRKNATLLFYWLGRTRSYLWVASAEKLVLVELPAESEMVPLIARYRQSLLDLNDPLKDGGTGAGKDGRALYRMLVAPAAAMIASGGHTVIFADGLLSQMNFETMVVEVPAPHYLIDDATLISAPSIRMFASSKPRTKSQSAMQGKLLLIGDPISPEKDFPDLRMAPLEVDRVSSHLSSSNESIFTRSRATPKAYLSSHPEQFEYIHFVSHGIANRLDPLDSAVVLSRADGSEDSYKLYARDILRHPVDARLVTISACNSSGTMSVAGEGLVGVSWAFLRAGAHSAIGGLWEVSDASTPQLMDQLYSGLELGQTPADALRNAKLALLHTSGRFRKPFYWAPFQLYAGR